MSRTKGGNASFFQAIEREAMALSYHGGRGVLFESLRIVRSHDKFNSPESLLIANQAWTAIRETVGDPKLKARVDGRIRLNEQKIAALEARRA